MYAGKVHNDGPDKLVIETGGQITPGTGTQAATIADPTDAANTQAAVVSILAALKGAGIIASS